MDAIINPSFHFMRAEQFPKDCENLKCLNNTQTDPGEVPEQTFKLYYVIAKESTVIMFS